MNYIFDAHDLDEDTLATLAGSLRTITGLKDAYLVRKRVAYLAEHPVFILAYTVHGWRAGQRRARAAAVLARIQASIAFPGKTLIVNIQDRNRGLASPVARATGAQLV